MKKINISKSKLNYTEYGSGIPLLLIAGLASDSQSWLPIITGLSRHFRIITFDNRGIGRSPQDNSNITIQKMADDCVELMEHINLSSAIVLGHSMGGMIAMDMAIRYPDAVDKLILEATAPSIIMRNKKLFSDWVSYRKMGMDSELWFRNLFYWILNPDYFNNEEMLNKLLTMSIEYPYPQTDKSFENQVKAISKFNCKDEIARIKIPTLVISGELDLLFSPNNATANFKRIAHRQFATIPKAAHSIHIDNPIDFIKTVIDFLIPFISPQ